MKTFFTGKLFLCLALMASIGLSITLAVQGRDISWSAVKRDFFLEVALGRIPGMTAINKFGRNVSLDKVTSLPLVAVGRDIWDGGVSGADPWVPPTAPRVHDLSSTSDEDGGAGSDTGALVVRVFGLDGDHLLQVEDVALNGVTAVSTAKTYRMIYRMKIRSTGTAGVNLGDIDAIAAVDLTLTARVSALANQTSMAIFQCPGDSTCFIWNAYSALHKIGGATNLADASLMIADPPTDPIVWRRQDTVGVATDGSTYIPREYKFPIVILPTGCVKMVAAPMKDAQDISAGFSILLVKNWWFAGGISVAMPHG